MSLIWNNWAQDFINYFMIFSQMNPKYGRRGTVFSLTERLMSANMAKKEQEVRANYMYYENMSMQYTEIYFNSKN